MKPAWSLFCLPVACSETGIVRTCCSSKNGSRFTKGAGVGDCIFGYTTDVRTAEVWPVEITDDAGEFEISHESENGFWLPEGPAVNRVVGTTNLPVNGFIYDVSSSGAK